MTTTAGLDPTPAPGLDPALAEHAARLLAPAGLDLEDAVTLARRGPHTARTRAAVSPRIAAALAAGWASADPVDLPPAPLPASTPTVAGTGTEQAEQAGQA